MADNPGFDLSKRLPWLRRTAAKVAATAGTLGRGELMTDESGHVYGGDGITPIKELSPLITRVEVGKDFIARPSGGQAGQALLRNADGGSYWGAVASGSSTLVVTDNGDGTFNISGPGVTENSDGTYTIAS